MKVVLKSAIEMKSIVDFAIRCQRKNIKTMD